MRPPKLSRIALDDGLKRRPLWSLSADGLSIQRLFVFESYMAGIKFVDRLAVTAEAADHHPDIEIGYKKVLLRFSTHSAKGLTLLDLQGAADADNLV